jgi:tripartite-type tricarboxylate transporter receptor subunit TctC
MVEPVPSAIQHVKSGRLKVLAVTSAKRASSLPQTPTVAESGLPGFELPSWYGVWGPAKMPAALVKKIESDLRTVILSESYKEAIGKMGSVARFEGQEQFSKTLKDTYNRNKEALSSK